MNYYRIDFCTFGSSDFYRLYSFGKSEREVMVNVYRAYGGMDNILILSVSVVNVPVVKD